MNIYPQITFYLFVIYPNTLWNQVLHCNMIFMFLCSYIESWASLVVQTVKNPPAMWETRVQPLGWEDPLEEGMATHSNILAWRIPMDRGAWQATWGRKESDTTERLSTHIYSHKKLTRLAKIPMDLSHIC